MRRSLIDWRADPPKHPAAASSFLPLLRVAVALHPHRLDLLCDLAVALRDDRRWEEIFDLLSPRVQSGGLTPSLACELARAAVVCARPELALDVLDTVPTGAMAGAMRQRVIALYALNRIDEARAAAAAALDEDPGDGTVSDSFANDCLTHGANGMLATLCQGAIDRKTASSKHVAYLAAALALDGRAADVARLIDPARLFSRTDLDIGQMDNEGLAQAILTHAALAPSPEGKPTHGRNLRLEGLAGIVHPAIRNLLAFIRQQVDVYLAERLDMQHPLIVQRPQRARLQGWALVLCDDGHEETHIHPQGWLTIIYYVRVPTGLVTGGASPAPGSLVFGPWPPAFAGALPDFPSWHIEPKAGTLLIFPSFFGHGTIPTSAEEPRICVALDVISCAAAPMP